MILHLLEIPWDGSQPKYKTAEFPDKILPQVQRHGFYKTYGSSEWNPELRTLSSGHEERWYPTKELAIDAAARELHMDEERVDKRLNYLRLIKIDLYKEKTYVGIEDEPENEEPSF